MKHVMRDSIGQYSNDFMCVAMDMADVIEGDFGFVMAFCDSSNSDDRRCCEWAGRILGCIDAAAI